LAWQAPLRGDLQTQERALVAMELTPKRKTRHISASFRCRSSPYQRKKQKCFQSLVYGCAMDLCLLRQPPYLPLPKDWCWEPSLFNLYV